MLATLMLWGSEGAMAQFRSSNFVPYSSVSVGIGTSSYYGDMAAYSRPFASTFGMLRWSATANYTRHFTPRFGARASFTWARITGDDFKMQSGDNGVPALFARNLHFRNDLKEFALTGIFKIIPDSRSYDRRPQFSPYLFAGIAAVAHNPVARVPDLDGDRWVKLQPLGTEGQGSPGYDKPYSLVQFAVPLGLGFRYKINARFDVGAELGFRFTSTDYLDDVSKYYPDPNVLKDDLARAMSNRSAEPTAARKGGDRTAGLQKFLAERYQITDPSVDPFVAIQQTDYASPGTARGTHPGRNDTYMTGTIHVTYILGSPIKCPPLK
ncbi:outer membrane beta-barrel protein [Cytophagaceae bacterium SJW1-29]|uniref:Outer membrane beta-barrel protein n=2 Tax=Salmonirosea aquatica TaxID=2654236 RepID=A0A7C9BI28_9BACT|nr:outer membrane beta-barrel protein [Cytophagaceae bacterium SJW1-29]